MLLLLRLGLLAFTSHLRPSHHIDATSRISAKTPGTGPLWSPADGLGCTHDRWRRQLRQGCPRRRGRITLARRSGIRGARAASCLGATRIGLSAAASGRVPPRLRTRERGALPAPGKRSRIPAATRPTVSASATAARLRVATRVRACPVLRWLPAAGLPRWLRAVRRETRDERARGRLAAVVSHRIALLLHRLDRGHRARDRRHSARSSRPGRAAMAWPWRAS